MNKKLDLFPDPCNSKEQIRLNCLKYAVYIYEAQCSSGKCISTPLELAQAFYTWDTSQEVDKPE